MKLAEAETEFPPGEVTFAMSNLSPRETGLDFAVFVLPEANLAALLAYRDGEIVYDQDVRAKLVPADRAR